MTLLFINNNLTTFYILLKWGVILEWQDKNTSDMFFMKATESVAKFSKSDFFELQKLKCCNIALYVYIYLKKKKTESWFEECVMVFLLDTSPSPPNSLAAKIPQDMEAVLLWFCC